MIRKLSRVRLLKDFRTPDNITIIRNTYGIVAEVSGFPPNRRATVSFESNPKYKIVVNVRLLDEAN